MQKNSIGNNDFFIKSMFAPYFKSNPIGFIDVGARFGSHSLVEPMQSHVSFLGFEPDKEECDRLNDDESLKTCWNAFDILPHALSNSHAKKKLRITSLANNSSLLKPNEKIINRYNMKEKWTVVKEYEVDTVPLDYLMYDLALGYKNSGEIIKLDTQGTELEILQGAQKLLTERTVCVVTEVEFCHIYKDQKLFSDVELYMRSLGYSFYGFLTKHTRSQRSLNKKTHLGRERLFYADAIFFKDPFDFSLDMNKRQYSVLLFSAILTGFYDFAHEIVVSNALGLSNEEAQNMSDLIQSLSFSNPQATHERLSLLVGKVDGDKENVNIHLGKFIDSLKFPDFEDCQIE